MCACFSRSIGRPNAHQNSHRGFANASRHRKQPCRWQQGLHDESRGNVATHLWACDQKNADAPRPSINLGDVEGPDAADHRGRGYRRSGHGRNLFIHMCADEGVGVRAPGDELVNGPRPKNVSAVFTDRNRGLPNRSAVPSDHAMLGGASRHVNLPFWSHWWRQAGPEFGPTQHLHRPERRVENLLEIVQ